VEPARELVAHWVAAARAMLGDAPNYSETEIDFGREDPPGYEMEIKLAGELDRYVFRVQRRGKLTPHQARKLAEERAERAEAKLAAIVTTCDIRTALARAGHGARHPDRLGDPVAASVDVESILAIIGTEGDCDHD
jgi:hypothetical protein